MDEKIYVDANQSASLLDGEAVTDCPTLQEAVIAWHRLPSERQRTATIRTAANVFTAQEIDRLYYGPEPEVSEQRENTRPFQPDPSKWGTSTWDDAAARIATSRSQRNDAALNSGGSQVFPPPQSAVSPTIQVQPVGASGVVRLEPSPSSIEISPTIQAQAGTAPREIRLETGKYALEGGSVNAELTGAFGMSADADVASAQRRVTTTITANLAANLPDNRAVAKGLLQATQIKITELRDARRNDRETTDLIEFLEWLAQGLTELGENIDRAIANPSEPMFLGAAGEIVQKLKSGLSEAVEKTASGFGK